MLKKTNGNMYGWVSHTKSYLGGECPHRCTYCYVQAMAQRFPALRSRYTGQPTLVEKELQEPLGCGRTIFIEHQNDLFADEIPADWIVRVLKHCCIHVSNTYVFQSKNRARFLAYLHRFPAGSILGTTLETNREFPDVMGHAPSPWARHLAMVTVAVRSPLLRRFVTIEPILDFDLVEFVDAIAEVKPTFVNIGADSKGTNLPEPRAAKVLALIDKLTLRGIEVRRKTNLARLLG